MIVKDDPELRHILAHLIMAIEAITEGNLKVAQHEIESIEGLVMWNSDQDMINHIEDRKMACTMRKTRKPKKTKSTKPRKVKK